MSVSGDNLGSVIGLVARLLLIHLQRELLHLIHAHRLQVRVPDLLVAHLRERFGLGEN